MKRNCVNVESVFRSKLLPLVHPNEKSLIGISEQVRRDELDLVQNAAFTDPDDSSAWFYHRWLLASKDHSDTPKIHFAKFLPEKSQLLIATSKDVKGGLVCSEDSEAFEAANGTETDCLWILKTSFKSDLTVIKLFVDQVEADQVTLTSKQPYISTDLLSFTTSTNDEVTRQDLETEMSNCRQLLELEPESKWTLLTLGLIAQAVDSQSHYEEILTIYDRLINVDAKRKHYYLDQRSKFVIRQELVKFFRQMKDDSTYSKLDLEKLNVSNLYLKHFLSAVTELRLPANYSDLDSLKLYLIQCKLLNGQEFP